MKNGEPVYIVEGEKDVLALEALGLTATCNPMGAGKWRDPYSDTLENADVVILPDNDNAGHDHAERVAKALENKAKSIRVVVLPGLKEKGDVSDWLDAGGTLEQLGHLVQDGGAYRNGGPGPLDAYLRIALNKLEPDWPSEPRKLPPKMPPVPELEPEMLPTPLRNWLVDAAELRAETQPAEALADRIRAGEVKDGDAVRDIYRRHWAHLDTPEKLETATKALEALGWLRVETRKTSGRPKTIIRLHPKLRGEG